MCTSCREEKELSEFHKYAQSTDGHRPRCKVCRSIEAKKSYENQTTETKERYKALQKTRDLDKKYGISLERYTEMLVEQDYKCKICSCKSTDLDGRALAVDHCRTTGEVRGLLCHKCNLGIGNFLDSTQRLENAIKYLGGYPHP